MVAVCILIISACCLVTAKFIIEWALESTLTEMLIDQMEGVSRDFLPYWFTAQLLSEYFACCAIIASIFIRNVKKTRVLELLFICELDESKEALMTHQDILRPLQEEIEEKRFKEDLLMDTSNIISQKGGNFYDAGDCTFTNSDLDSQYN